MQKQGITERLVKLALFISFLFCYLEWGGTQSGFIYQMEYTILSEKLLSESITHPFVFFPLTGQLLLLVLVFMPASNRRLTLIAILMLSILALMVLLVGILSMNMKIIAFCIPFILLAVYYIFFSGRIKSQT